MDKNELEALLARIDIWLLVFGIIVVIGVAGESFFGIRHWWNSRKLQALQNAENDSQRREIARLDKEAGQARQVAATAIARAAELEKQAEEEKSARLKIEERMAWRRVSARDHDALVAQLRAHSGATIELVIHDELEASTFAQDIIKTFRDAGWLVRISRVGMTLPPSYGLICIVNETFPAGSLLVSILKSLPTAKVETSDKLQVVARIEVALKPPL